MATRDEVVTRCREALTVMYSATVEFDTRAEANRYLTWVSDQPIAWEVLDQLLTQSDLQMQHYFWTANLLLSCLQRRFRELPSAPVRAAFRDSLLSHLDRFLPSPYAQVTARLARCVGVLVYHLSAAGEWPTAVPDLCVRYSQGPALTALVEALTMAAEMCISSRAHIVVTAEVAAALPGASRGKLRRHVRHTALAALSAESARVLDVLSQLLQATQEVPVQNTVFRCLAEWAGAGCVDIASFQTHALFPALFDAVRVPALTVAVSDTLAGLLAQVASAARNGKIELEPLLVRVASAALPLLPYLHSLVAEGSFAEAAALGSIFTELAHASVDYIAPCGPAPGPSGDFGLAVLDAAVQVAEARPAPGSEAETESDGAAVGPGAVTAVTFTFWRAIGNLVDDIMGEVLRSRDHAERAGRLEEVAEARAHAEIAEARMAQLAPLLGRAVAALVATMQFPGDAHERPDGELSEVRDHRKAAASAMVHLVECLGLRAAMQVVGPLAAEGLQAYTRGAQTGAGWQMLEAALYAVRMGMRLQGQTSSRAEREAIAPMLALIMEMRAVLAAARPAAEAQGANSPAGFGYDSVRYTATLVLGQYAHLIDSDAALAATLGFIAEGVSAKGVAGASATALRNLSDVLAPELATTSLTAVYEVYDMLPLLGRDAQKDVLTAVVNVTAALPDAEAFVSGLRLVLGRLVDALTNILAAGVPDAANTVTVLQLLARAVEAVNPRYTADPPTVMAIVVNAVQALAPSLETVIKHYSADQDVTEAVVAIWRTTMNVCGRHSWPIAPELCTAACNFFDARPLSAYVYLADRFIALFASPDHERDGVTVPFDGHQYAVTLLEFFAQRVPALLLQWGSVDEHPEIIDDFVSLGMTSLRHCPDTFLSLQPVVAAITQTARQALVATHKDAHHAAVRYYDTVFTRAIVQGQAGAPVTPQLATLLALARSEAQFVFVETIASAGGSRALGVSLFGVGLAVTALNVCSELAGAPAPACSPALRSPAQVIESLLADPRLAALDTAALRAEVAAAGTDRPQLRRAFAHIMHALKGEEFEDDNDW